MTTVDIAAKRAEIDEIRARRSDVIQQAMAAHPSAAGKQPTPEPEIARFFVDLTAAGCATNEVWLEVEATATPGEVLDALEALTQLLAPSAGSPRLTVVPDARGDDACPNCRTGLLRPDGRPERGTNWQDVGCADCGWTSR